MGPFSWQLACTREISQAARLARESRHDSQRAGLRSFNEGVYSSLPRMVGGGTWDGGWSLGAPKLPRFAQSCRLGICWPRPKWKSDLGVGERRLRAPAP
jgi:hypothetical protein